jgi:RNA polymerase sigma-70 factor (ECF subfamily)
LTGAIPPADDARAALTACLHRISLGDRAALEQLYHATSAKLFGLVKRILGESGAAEDVLQEVFLAVWKKAGQFEPGLGVSPITWLAAIARNRALDRLRAGKRRLAPLEAAAEMADPAPGADVGLEMRESQARLADCLAGLDERAQGAIREAFFGGHTYATLAAKADMKLASMKSLIRRGLIQLRKCLDS